MKHALAICTGTLGLVLGETAALHAVPPPPEQYSTDCARSVYASDQLVCQTPELKALDSALAAQITAADSAPFASGNRFTEGHGEWFRRRSMCAMQTDHLSCLRAAYADRQRLIERLGKPLPAADQRFICRLTSNGTSVLLSFMSPAEVIIANEAGLVVGVASNAKPISGWRPFLTFQKKRSSLILTDAQDASISCKLTRFKP
ncbi:hypothetical protein DXH95_10705 [Sphingorhabdus pulchriflava]|uniref:Lysozyme inhibitor LprI N-terminal domain-containing protein n=1 Tax=Sphingorhabdus pulchriflava TaxID=2292257 RepID=A0A371B4S6_9SPHN|nr:hypothetical protein [Sphingorhabdus pulchriflava]RDV02443.1 hypothetical protein DXH95_10705 [Sphingorhabdus pulchriflava]